MSGASVSHEVLLVAGSPDTVSRERRARLLALAVSEVPGMSSWETFENDYVTIALVQTTPEGGTAAVFDRSSDGGLTLVIGTSREAAHAVREGAAGPWSGAEHGHVEVAVAPDGSIDVSADGTGIIPSFWSGDRHHFRFTTHLASIVSLGAAPDLDEQGALEYLVMLQPLGTRTVVADVSLLVAGGRLDVRPGRAPELVVERLFRPSGERMSDDEAVHEFSAIWSALTSDLLARSDNDRLALGLSGGLDSRAMAVECVRQGGRPHAFTYGSSATRPAQVAAEVAQILQLDHTLLALDDDRLMPDPARLATLLDGAHSPAEMYELWFGAALKGFADVVLNGKAGGTLWGDEKALGITDPTQLQSTLEGRFAAELSAVSGFLDPDLAGSARELFGASLRESLEEWDARSRRDIALFWNVNNRQYRWGNMLTNALRRSGIRLEAPYMDSRFLQFSARLTFEQRLNGALHLRVHKELFALTAGVARSDDGNPPSQLSHVYWSAESSYGRQFMNLAKKHPVSALRRASGRVQSNVARRLEQTQHFSRLGDDYAARHSVFAADAWLRGNETYRARMLDFLTSSSTPSMISADAVAKAASQVAEGSSPHGALRLARIATLQEWHQDFARRSTATRSLQ